MKTPMGSKNYLTIALTAIALLLGGLLYWEWDQGMRLERDLTNLRKIPVTPIVLQAVLPEFTLPNAESGFPELISRSLFVVSRRSSGSATKGGLSAMKKGQFVLVGVLITPMQRSALLRDVQTNKTETVATSGVVRGLTLGEVEPGRVILRQGAESEELILNVQIGPKAPSGPQNAPALLPPVNAAPSPFLPPGPAPSASSRPVPGGVFIPGPGVPPKSADLASAPKTPPPPNTDFKK